MKTKLLLCSLLGILFSISTSGQGLKISDKADEFLKDAQNVLLVSQNPQAAGIGKNLETAWTGGKISEPNKQKLAVVSNLMLKKGYKPALHFVPLFDAVSLAVNTSNISSPVLESYLETLRKAVESGDSKTTVRFIEVSRSYFNNQLIYSSNFNKFYVLKGTVLFKYNDQKVEINKPVSNPPAATAQPEAPKKTTGFDDWDTPATATPSAGAPAFDEKLPQILSEGPSIEFKGVNLVIATSNDSVALKNSNASISLKDGVLLGNGGTFSWEVAGQPEVFASLGNYSMDVRNPKIGSDDATLTYGTRLAAPVKGIFEYLSKKRAKNAPSQYPRFMSQDNNITLKNMGDIEYKGGFALAAGKIYSSSVNSRYATILVKKEGKVVIKAISRRFEISDSLITAPAAMFTAYIATSDSLHHPSVKFAYNRSQKSLRVGKVDEGGFKEASYLDSYHKLDITADAMRWNLNDQRMEFYILSGKNVVPALFESFDFYNPARFDNISGNNNFNPLLIVSNYARKNNQTTVYLSEMARSYQKDPASIRPAMLEMMQKGFLIYDPEVESLQISRKGQHYLAAHNTRKDYDNLLIASLYNSSSKDTTSNATFNLKDNQLIIRGVKQFYLSDSLNVYMTPVDKVIKVNKDRNFVINGELKTGNFRFRGSDLAFNYSDFSVKLNKIDSITFVPQKELARKGNTEIGGDLKYESGTIYINKPDNKSGRQRMPEFPRLVIPTGVVAYFDHSWRANGVYNKKIFFKVPSIDFDSLNVKDIDFVGTFNSDGIFPPFKETLISMPDNTLGFRHRAVDGKYNLYNSKSFMKFSGNLLMDKTGLHSEGEINHLAAQIQAKEAYFMPDSLIARGLTGQINEGAIGNAYFTKVDIKNFSLKWQPKVDSMLISTKGNTFDFFAASSKLEGELLIRQSGLLGYGKVRRADSETESQHFKFGKDSFTAEPADLVVGTNLKAFKPSLLGKNMNVSFNVATGLVSILTPLNTKIGDTTNLIFPYSAYKTSINKAVWDINKKTITMKGDVSTSTFTSTEPSQEGLSFNASEALYEIDKQILNIKGVPFIKSADAKIIPDKGSVLVKRDSELGAFTNARLQIDTLNGYHNLIKGNIRILSKSRFEGDATYSFVNLSNDTVTIKMGNFESKESVADAKKKTKSYMTVAKAAVAENENFHLSAKLLFKGDIAMIASEKNLRLDGFVRPYSKGKSDAVNWIAYKGNSTDGVNIVIDQNLKGEQNIPVVAGLHFRTTSTGLYTSFLTAKENPKDEDIFLANGLLKDIVNTGKFEISNEEKDPKKVTYEGNHYEYDDDKKLVKLEGKFNFFTPAEFVQTAGYAEVRTDTAKAKFDEMLVVNFPVPAEVLKVMGEKIVKTNLDSRANDKSADEPDDKDRLLSKLANIVGGKAIDPLEKRVKNEHVPFPGINPKLNTTIVISKANLRYSEAASSFYTVGKLSVASIGGTDVNSELDGYLEIRKSVDGDEFYLYLEPTEDIWYFMGYLKNEMGVVSSDGEFNNTVAAKTKGAKKSSGKNSYNFTSVGAEEKVAFVERFTDSYRPKSEKGKKLVKSEEPQKVQEKEKKKEETKTGF